MHISLSESELREAVISTTKDLSFVSENDLWYS